MSVDDKEYNECNGISVYGIVGWWDGGFLEFIYFLEGIRVDRYLGIFFFSIKK